MLKAKRYSVPTDSSKPSFLLSYLVFFPEAFLLTHWVVFLCLSSPGWSFVDLVVQERSEALERVQHLTGKG